LESLLNEHGSLFIDRIEEIAQKSSRFQYVLSGVWPSKEFPKIHSRVKELQATGPHMDKGDPFPEE